MKKTTYTMIGLSIALLISIGFNAMPEPTHKCDSRELKAYCFDMSSTAKTCYTLPNKIGGRRCTEGWKELKIQSGEWFDCNPDGCKIKN